MIDLAEGTVKQIVARRAGAVELLVEVGGETAAAIAYPELIGEVEIGETVVLNTTAVRLGLGTGGAHFVVARSPERMAMDSGDAPGHIMKLRYTPLQHRCLSVEEADSPHRAALQGCHSLAGAPVVLAPLHSMLAAAAAGVRAAAPEARIVYVMADTAALPIAFSRLVPALKLAGLVESTVTVGQAFGGDLEAVNLFSGLIAARAAAGADVIIVAQGPGNVGTDTEYGFSAIAQGEWVNAAAALGGDAIAVPRISFADPRERHRGLSRQTIAALTVAARERATVVLPELAPDQRKEIEAQVESSGLGRKHRIVFAAGEPGLREAERRGIELVSMGRPARDDPAFFLAAAAAGAVAAERLSQGRPAGRPRGT
jgi:hypothetical protein